MKLSASFSWHPQWCLGLVSVREMELADRSLIQLCPERLCQSLTSREVDARSTRTPMEDIGKGLKELKGFATLQKKKNNINQPTRHPRAPRNLTTNQRIHLEGPMAPAVYLAEDGLVGHQWEERPLVL